MCFGGVCEFSVIHFYFIIFISITVFLFLKKYILDHVNVHLMAEWQDFSAQIFVFYVGVNKTFNF